MDLYGDILDNVDDKETAQATLLLGNAWSNVSSKVKPVASSKETAVKVSKPVAAKFTPSTLLFKPRKMAAPIKPTPVPKHNHPAVPIEATQDNVILSETVSSTSDHDVSNISQVDSVEAFNVNSSFEVEDPYDPGRPNDYMAYCNERNEVERRRKIAEENVKRIEEVELMRAELERERKEATEKQDYHKLFEQAASVPSSSSSVPLVRGRGRGIANLPAWLTQKMENTDELPSLNIDPSPQFSDNTESSGQIHATVGHKRKAYHLSKPSKVILLLNMVSFDEAHADDGLIEDTKAECGKYGEVLDGALHIVDSKDPRFESWPESERVRVFISFSRQDSAARALKDLNGRYFGGRKVSAMFYKEEKFNSKILEPDLGES